MSFSIDITFNYLCNSRERLPLLLNANILRGDNHKHQVYQRKKTELAR